LARHVLPLEAAVQRDDARRAPAAPGAGGREPAAEADGGGPGAEHSGPQGRPGKRVVTPMQRRAVVTDTQAQHTLPLATACRYLGVHRALLRYVVRRTPPAALVARVRELAVLKPRWGSPRLTWRLRREGWPVNHKRVERLLRLEGLQVGQRPRRKRAAVARVPAPVPQRPNERWSMDFVRDTTSDGRPFRVWALV